MDAPAGDNGNTSGGLGEGVGVGFSGDDLTPFEGGGSGFDGGDQDVGPDFGLPADENLGGPSRQDKGGEGVARAVDETVGQGTDVQQGGNTAGEELVERVDELQSVERADEPEPPSQLIIEPQPGYTESPEVKSLKRKLHELDQDYT